MSVRLIDTLNKEDNMEPARSYEETYGIPESYAIFGDIVNGMVAHDDDEYENTDLSDGQFKIGNVPFDLESNSNVWAEPNHLNHPINNIVHIPVMHNANVSDEIEEAAVERSAARAIQSNEEEVKPITKKERFNQWLEAKKKEYEEAEKAKAKELRKKHFSEWFNKKAEEFKKAESAKEAKKEEPVVEESKELAMANNIDSNMPPKLKFTIEKCGITDNSEIEALIEFDLENCYTYRWKRQFEYWSYFMLHDYWKKHGKLPEFDKVVEINKDEDYYVIFTKQKRSDYGAEQFYRELTVSAEEFEEKKLEFQKKQEEEAKKIEELSFIEIAQQENLLRAKEDAKDLLPKPPEDPFALRPPLPNQKQVLLGDNNDNPYANVDTSLSYSANVKGVEPGVMAFMQKNGMTMNSDGVILGDIKPRRDMKEQCYSLDRADTPGVITTPFGYVITKELTLKMSISQIAQMLGYQLGTYNIRGSNDPEEPIIVPARGYENIVKEVYVQRPAVSGPLALNNNGQVMVAGSLYNELQGMYATPRQVANNPMINMLPMMYNPNMQQVQIKEDVLAVYNQNPGIWLYGNVFTKYEPVDLTKFNTGEELLKEFIRLEEQRKVDAEKGIQFVSRYMSGEALKNKIKSLEYNPANEVYKQYVEDQLKMRKEAATRQFTSYNGLYMGKIGNPKFDGDLNSEDYNWYDSHCYNRQGYRKSPKITFKDSKGNIVKVTEPRIIHYTEDIDKALSAERSRAGAAAYRAMIPQMINKHIAEYEDNQRRWKEGLAQGKAPQVIAWEIKYKNENWERNTRKVWCYLQSFNYDKDRYDMILENICGPLSYTHCTGMRCSYESQKQLRYYEIKTGKSPQELANDPKVTEMLRAEEDVYRKRFLKSFAHSKECGGLNLHARPDSDEVRMMEATAISQPDLNQIKNLEDFKRFEVRRNTTREGVIDIDNYLIDDPDCIMTPEEKEKYRPKTSAEIRKEMAEAKKKAEEAKFNEPVDTSKMSQEEILAFF